MLALKRPEILIILSAYILALAGCGGSKSAQILDPEAVLEQTSRLLVQAPGVEVTEITYSEETQEALANLEPVAGMPFRLTGSAELTITQDLTQTVDAASRVDEETLRQISDAVKKYDIGTDPRKAPSRRATSAEDTKEWPRAYTIMHQKGEHHIVGWKRDVVFHPDADTGKLGAQVMPVELSFVRDSEDSTYGKFGNFGMGYIDSDELYRGLGTSTEGYDVDDPKAVEALNVYFQQYREELIAEGRQRLADGIKALSTMFAKDAVFTDEKDYLRFTTPEDLSQYISLDDLAESKLIPCQLTWIDAAGNALLVAKINYSVDRLIRQPDGSYAIELSSKSRNLEVPWRNVQMPESLEEIYRYNRLKFSSQDKDYPRHLMRQMDFVCWADEFASQDVTDSELVENFKKMRALQHFVESTPLLCQLSRSDKPYAMVMRFNQGSGDGPETVVTTNLANGVQTTWTIHKDSPYDVSHTGVNPDAIMYRLERKSEKIPNAHDFDRSSRLLLQVYADGSIKFEYYKGTITAYQQ